MSIYTQFLVSAFLSYFPLIMALVYWREIFIFPFRWYPIIHYSFYIYQIQRSFVLDESNGRKKMSKRIVNSLFSFYFSFYYVFLISVFSFFLSFFFLCKIRSKWKRIVFVWLKQHHEARQLILSIILFNEIRIWFCLARVWEYKEYFNKEFAK